MKPGSPGNADRHNFPVWGLFVRSYTPEPTVYPMPIRLLPIVVLSWPRWLFPRARRAADYVRGEVIVHYEDGTSAAESDVLEDATGADAEQALPGGSQQLAIEDGDSVPATIAELEADPNVAYAVPNMVAHASGTTSDPDSRRQWNLFGGCGINLVEAWALAESRGAPGGRGAVVAVIDSGVAYERPRAATSARPTCAARPSSSPGTSSTATAIPTTSTATARTWRARSPRPPTTASAPRGSPTTRRSCPCACWTAPASATRPPSRARSATPCATAPT